MEKNVSYSWDRFSDLKVMVYSFMKIAVFSDIHSNLSAFTASLAFARHLGAEGYVFLGDLVSDCSDPHATMEQIRKLRDQAPCWFVRGNREEYLLAHHKNPNDDWKPSSQTGSLLYTYERLTPEDLQMLAAMPKTDRVEISGHPPIRICHATPNSLNELIYPGAEQADNLLKSIDEGTILSAHSHMQFRYESGGKQLINPGSMGIHSRGMTKAQFALVRCEEGRWIARMLNVDYDRVAELQRLDASELPKMAGVWAKLVRLSIATGQNRMVECLELAHRLAQADRHQFVEDGFWEAAAKQLGVI